MKTKEEFIKDLLKLLSEHNFKSYVYEDIQPDGSVVTYLQIENGDDVPIRSSTIKLYKQYLIGFSISDICEILESRIEVQVKEKRPMSEVYKWDHAKDRLSFTLVNYPDNMDELNDIVHFVIADDLAAVLSIDVSTDCVLPKFIQVTKPMFNSWNVLEETVIKIALKSITSNAVCYSATEVLAAAYGMERASGLCNLWDHEDMENDELYREMPDGTLTLVLSNIMNGFGASSILSKAVLERTKKILGGKNFIIVPSSIHEVWIAPCSDFSECDLEEIIIPNVGVLRTVRQEDCLSNHLYYYNGKDIIPLYACD